MCVVSMVMDHYYDKWKPVQPGPIRWNGPPMPTQDEINEFHRLLDRAREYDKRNNEPDCEMKEKRDRLLKLAEELGVKIDFV